VCEYLNYQFLICGACFHFKVTWQSDSTVRFQPQAAGDNSAVLILSLVTAKDFTLTVVATTIQQLEASPHPWEVFWVFFNYQQIGGPQATNKTTNYFILKTSGCELGLAYDNVGQTFLDTTTTPTNTLGTPYEYTVVKTGKQVTISLNGTQIFANTYDQLYDQNGFIGLYCEESLIQVYSVDFVSNDSTTGGTTSSSGTDSNGNDSGEAAPLKGSTPLILALSWLYNLWV
jgi:hypothetical protein